MQTCRSCGKEGARLAPLRFCADCFGRYNILAQTIMTLLAYNPSLSEEAITEILVNPWRVVDAEEVGIEYGSAYQLVVEEMWRR
jgi:hypothetical protein